MSVSRTLRTVRYLRPRQIGAQLRHRSGVRRRIPETARSASASPWPGVGWSPVRPFLAPSGQTWNPSDLSRGRFTFLNQTESLGWPPDWQAFEQSRLWQYNLHYHEWLWPLNYSEAKGAVLSWIRDYPHVSNASGWEPYPVSLRLLNWCPLFCQRWREETKEDTGFRVEIWNSIQQQADWLAGHIEYHLMANHLLENAAALTVAGACFDGPRATQWFEQGFSILREQIPEQILSDGMHFERSPMYHARMLYLMLTLANLDRVELKALLEGSIGLMADASRCLRHPDGRIALFNDSAFGIAPEPEDLLEEVVHFAGEDSVIEQFGCWALPEAGYYGWNGRDGAYLICDAGPIGPGYQPGHAHGDCFSFELSLRGHRVIVDGGVLEYNSGAMRRLNRSTRIHNTVEVEGEDQCEFWGAFRVARRGRPRDVFWQPRAAGFALSGWFDGYRRLDGRPAHWRSIQWQDPGTLWLLDRVVSEKNSWASTRLHLHPDCHVEHVEGPKALVTTPAGDLLVSWKGKGEPVHERSVHCPEFGRQIDNDCLAFMMEGSDMHCRTEIALC